MSNAVLFNKCPSCISAYNAFSGCMQLLKVLNSILSCSAWDQKCQCALFTKVPQLSSVLIPSHTSSFFIKFKFTLLFFFPPASSSYSSSSASFQANQPASTFSRSPCATWSAAASNGLWSPLWSTRCWRRLPPPRCLLPPSSPPHTPSPCPAWRSRRSPAAREKSFSVSKTNKLAWEDSTCCWSNCVYSHVFKWHSQCNPFLVPQTH